jgi:hypothetical protein
MALHAVNTPNLDSGDMSFKPALSACPVCDGQMEVVYARNNQQVSVCKDCHLGLTVPGTAWDIVRVKREGKWTPKC